MVRSTTLFVYVVRDEEAKKSLEAWNAENEKQSHEDDVSQEASESILGKSHEY